MYPYARTQNTQKHEPVLLSPPPQKGKKEKKERKKKNPTKTNSSLHPSRPPPPKLPKISVVNKSPKRRRAFELRSRVEEMSILVSMSLIPI